MKKSVFDNLLAELHALAPAPEKNPHETFVLLQRFEVAIIDKYNAGIISDREYRALLNVAFIMMDEYRKEVNKNV